MMQKPRPNDHKLPELYTEDNLPEDEQMYRSCLAGTVLFAIGMVLLILGLIITYKALIHESTQ